MCMAKKLPGDCTFISGGRGKKQNLWSHIRRLESDVTGSASTKPQALQLCKLKGEVKAVLQVREQPQMEMMTTPPQPHHLSFTTITFSVT